MSLQFGQVSLKQEKRFKYLSVALLSDGKQDEELDVQSDKASAVSFPLFSSLKRH